MTFTQWSEEALFENGFSVSACKAILHDAKLLAVAVKYDDAELSSLFQFVPKERERRWHNIEFTDHTADVLTELHFALGGLSPTKEESAAADRAISELLRRHRPNGLARWWNRLCHGNGLGLI